MPPDSIPDAPPDRPNRGWWRFALVLPVLFLVVAAGLIATGQISRRVDYDQLLYHEPTIRLFAQQWPDLDFKDYLSATTPGYHVLMAAVAVYAGEAVSTLQAAGAAITALLLLVLGLELARQTRPMHALALSLPLVASVYVFSSGVWLLPDNAGWLGVLLVMVLALRQPRTTREAVVFVLMTGVAVACVTLVRQIHVWTAGLVIASAWISRERDKSTPTIPLLFENMHQRAPWLGLGLLAALPSFLIVLAFARLWDGRLVPPAFKDQYAGNNLSATPFILSLVGIFSLFYIATLGRAMLTLVRRHHDWFVLALIVSVLLALVPPTTFNYDTGRKTGLWNMAHALSWMDILGHTSPLMFVLTVWGGLCGAAWMTPLSSRDRVVLTCGMAGFCAAHSMSPEVWQRYVEPFALIWIGLAAARGAGADPTQSNSPRRQLEIAGPMLLALLLTVQSVRSMSSLHPMGDGAPPVETPDKAAQRQAPVYRYWNARGRDQPPRDLHELYRHPPSTSPRPGESPSPRAGR